MFKFKLFCIHPRDSNSSVIHPHPAPTRNDDDNADEIFIPSPVDNPWAGMLDESESESARHRCERRKLRDGTDAQDGKAQVSSGEGTNAQDCDVLGGGGEGTDAQDGDAQGGGESDCSSPDSTGI